MRNAKLNDNKYTELIYPELSYKINGILFKVRIDLGGYCNEKQYGDLVEIRLKENKIIYEREKILPPQFEGEQVGRNKVDFFIENKIVLEIKAKRSLDRDDYYQIQRYLNSLNRKLGIVVNFRQKFIKPKRIINSAAKE